MLQGEEHLLNQNQMIMVMEVIPLVVEAIANPATSTNPLVVEAIANPKTSTNPLVVEAIPNPLDTYTLPHNCQKGSEDGDIYADSYYFKTCLDVLYA